jgi:DNA-binding PadR family transcriptional regulator
MRAGRVSLALRQDRWYYELTRRGRAELETQTTAWHKLAATISQVLETA